MELKHAPERAKNEAAKVCPSTLRELVHLVVEDWAKLPVKN